jgi:NADP-dependent 3-hydroxy acid dehydrogenase YdfG
MISPRAVATEVPESSSEEATRKNLREFYKMANPANSIAGAIAYAIEQPPRWKSTRLSSGTQRKISNVKRKEVHRWPI